MYTATLTNQGQITIPIEVRKRAGLIPGNIVSFVPMATDGSKFEMVKQLTWESLNGILRAETKKEKFTPSKLKKVREQMYTERYKRYLKQ